MIKLEHVVLPSPEQMKFVIEGMRNPMNSWDKSDSVVCPECRLDCVNAGCDDKNKYWDIEDFGLGKNDYSLMEKLAQAGTDHRKFMRMMPVYVRITAPLYWWKEFDTYKIATVGSSCSTMHKIAEKKFTLDDFSHEHLDDLTLDALNYVITQLEYDRRLYLKTNDKEYWWRMIQFLPSSYNQTRNVMMNFEVLANIYRQRKSHKLDEWREFCRWIEKLPHSELITGEDK